MAPQRFQPGTQSSGTACATRGQVSTALAGGDTLVSSAVSRISPAVKDPEVSRFQARVQAGRRSSTERQTDGGAGQSIFECSELFCRGRACSAAYGDRRETSHCNLSQSGHMPLQCFVPNTRRIIRTVLVSSASKPTSAKLGQTGPKSNRYVSLCRGGRHFAKGSCKNATKLTRYAPLPCKKKLNAIQRLTASCSRGQPPTQSTLPLCYAVNYTHPETQFQVENPHTALFVRAICGRSR